MVFTVISSLWPAFLFRGLFDKERMLVVWNQNSVSKTNNEHNDEVSQPHDR